MFLPLRHRSLLIISLIFAALAFSSLSLNAGGLNADSLITLNGPWKFKTGDDIKWASPDFNDADWEMVDLTAPPGAHDGDVGLSGYIPGWTAKGHAGYSGYAWYRLRIGLDSVNGNQLALTGPPAVDDAYQIYVNGILLGSGGADFSRAVPVAYSIQPRMFLLPELVRSQKSITITVRVWMSAATLTQGPDLGGIHIAPVLGGRESVASRYNFQWGQTIKGYIVEIILPVLFILLAVFVYKRSGQAQSCKWFITALILLGMIRANQAVFYWFQFETAHAFDIVTEVLLRPLITGCWLMAWREWFRLERTSWMPKVIAFLTLVYMGCQLMALPWFMESAPHAVFQTIGNYTRLLFLALLFIILYSGIRQPGRKGWGAILGLLLVSVGLFSQEVSALHIQGIWFPFGVGVSRTQYVYGAFVVVMFIVLALRKRKKERNLEN